MNPELENLKDKASRLPLLPGVYIMLDDSQKIIYIGKAKKLKNRVSSYFHGEHLPKVAAMVDKVRDFNVIVVSSEFEALVLENSLIKMHKPHYNILLKDDKGYPFIKIDTDELYPRLSVSGKKDGKGKYYGPFGTRGKTEEIIDAINKTFKLPDCTRKFPRDIGKERPCLNYQLGICDGWCLPKRSSALFRERIYSVELILEGKVSELITELNNRMMEAAEKLHFEEAAEIRDRIKAVSSLTSRQNVISAVYSDTDAIGFCNDAKSCFSVLHFRDGNLVSKDINIVNDIVEDYSEALVSFICSFYSDGRVAYPRDVLLPIELEENDDLAEFLSNVSGHNVRVSSPKRGEKFELVKKAQLNAEEEVKRRVTEEQHKMKSLESLAKMTGISDFPHRIEAFDISNLGNTGIVAAMTVFIDGKPSRKDYRRFRIRDLEIQNDYASMYQAVYRRFKRFADEDEKFSDLPDILFIDGGIEHARIALKALEQLGLVINVFGMVKDDRHRTRALITSEGKEIGISGNQGVFSLVGTVQEETHRFAIEYQRLLRTKNIKSELDEIPGIGEKRKNDLIKRFKTIKAIKEAGVNELNEVLPLNVSESVYNYFHDRESEKK